MQIDILKIKSFQCAGTGLSGNTMTELEELARKNDFFCYSILISYAINLFKKPKEKKQGREARQFPLM